MKRAHAWVAVGVLALLLVIAHPLFMVIAVTAFILAYTNKSKKDDQPESAVTPQPAKGEPEPKNHFYFNVVGVTRKNDQGKDIQKLIRAYVKDEVEFSGSAYEGLTNKEILESGEDVYEADVSGNYEVTLQPEPSNPYDPDAVKVIHESIGHIGYVPREHTGKALKAISEDHEIEWRIVGGKYKYVDREEEKVRTKTLTYGITVDVDYQKGVIPHERPRKEKEK